MNDKTNDLLLMIASAGLAIGGLILIAVEIVSETKDNTLLGLALMSILLSNLFNLIRAQRNSGNDRK